MRESSFIQLFNHFQYGVYVFTKEDLISLNKEFVSRTKELYETGLRIDRILIKERDVTPGQLMYLTDVRSKIEAACNLAGSASAEFNDFVDTDRFNPDDDPRDGLIDLENRIAKKD
jgi:hypothetical protein